MVTTERAKPVARLLAMEVPPSLLATVTARTGGDYLVDPTGEAWEARRGRV